MMTHQPFNWNEEANKILHHLLGEWGANPAFEKEQVDEALQSLSQAFKQAVDAAEPEERPRFGPLNINGDYPPEEYENGGYNQATADFKANIYKIIDGETE